MTKNAAYLLRPLRQHSVYALAALAVLCLALGMALFTTPAAADEEQNETSKTALELQQQIEAAQQAYSEAHDHAEQIRADIDKNEQLIQQLEQQIPEQQERSSRAAREMYKYQQQSAGLVEFLLNAESLEDFLRSFEYMTKVSDDNMREMNRLAEMKNEISQAQEDLQKSYAQARTQADEAGAALEDLQRAQAEVQRRIEEEARLAAEIAAQAKATAEQPRNNDDGASAAAAQEAEQPADAGAGEAPAAAPAVSAPDPNMSSDEAAFVAEWSARIDAYLAGSPLAGQGGTFARAAYAYGVDPRWSPAISFTESSKGLYCFNPHNAWGWGSASWDSWEEAIFDHVRGLSRGYGYTISEEAAQKYCPPNWQNWYNRTLSQMNMI